MSTMARQIARKLRQAVRPRRGTEVLEAAFIFPFLLLFVFGTVEYGYYFHVQHACAGAAREGARAAIPPGATTTDVDNAVGAIMTSAGFTDYEIDYDPSPVEDAVTGDPVEITVKCLWGDVGVSPLQLIGSTTEVVGKATMRKEGFE